MKTMQKILTILLASTLLFAFPACTKYEAGTEQTNETTTIGATATETPNETTVTATESTAHQKETPDTPAEEYTGILTYDYAYEPRYYSCMYVTPDRVYIWNSATEPNVNEPTASEGFANAYTEPLPRTQFEQATAAISEEFLAMDFGDYAEKAEKRQAPLEAPTTHIAVYRDGELCRHRDGVIEWIAADAKGFRALFAELSAIRDAIEAEKNSPKIVAILQYTKKTNGYGVAYYTARESLQWECAAPPDWDAPLSGIDENTQVTREQGASSLLYKLGYYSEYMPLRVYETAPDKIPAGGSFEVIVFYREDGSRRVISAHASDYDSRALNTMRAYFALHWAKPA